MQDDWKVERSRQGARELGTEEQHSDEFPGLYFCLIYPRLELSKLATQKSQYRQTMTKACSF